MVQKYDKAWLAAEYNLLPPGGVLRIPRPTNVHQFKRSLEARGVKEKVDFTARGQDNECIIRRLTLTKLI